MVRPDDQRKKRVMAQGMKPTLQVGKEGMTPKVVAELVRQIRSRGLVKVRLNASFAVDVSDAAAELAEASSAEVVDIRGRTVVLSRR